MIADRDGTAGPETATAEGRARPRRLGRWRAGLLLPLLLLLAYYAGGALYLHRIDDDPAFASELELPEGASYSVAVAVALIDREVNRNRWVANDPLFQPGALLDNMPQFQKGIVSALSRFAVELADQLARIRGSSEIDPDADTAAGRLKYPGDVWILEWSSTPVQPSSESQYRKALEALSRYNQRLAAGEAVFDSRADNLLATLDRIASDLGSASAALSDRIQQGGGLLDFGADDLFYATKGRLYAYLLLLRALGRDFAPVIAERNLERAWEQLLFTLEQAATLRPWVVANGDLDGLLVPNHLAAQGFLLLRARTQLREITNILLK